MICLSGKRCYPSRGAARAAMEALQRKRAAERGNRGKREQRYYRCDGCGAWHLTSRAEQQVRRAA